MADPPETPQASLAILPSVQWVAEAKLIRDGPGTSKSEIRSTKSETNPKEERKKYPKRKPRNGTPVRRFRHFPLSPFLPCFGFRAWDFGFPA
jgi:hypothetical protein